MGVIMTFYTFLLIERLMVGLDIFTYYSNMLMMMGESVLTIRLACILLLLLRDVAAARLLDSTGRVSS